jgi:hypothetical protein
MTTLFLNESILLIDGILLTSTIPEDYIALGSPSTEWSTIASFYLKGKQLIEIS